MDQDNLFNRIRAGSAKAYLEMLRKHEASLYSVAKSQLGKNTDFEVDDVVHGVFVWIWENKENLPIDANIEAYLIKTTRNKCMDVIRHTKTRRVHKAGYLEYKENFFSQQLLETKQLRQALSAAIYSPQISTRGREIFLLHFVDGYRLKDVAAMLGIHYHTAKNQIHRAVKVLRVKLKPELV